jgi:predicted aspartyl protease
MTMSMARKRPDILEVLGFRSMSENSPAASELPERTMTGHTDDRGRLFTRLFFVGKNIYAEGMIDTGFTGYVFMEEARARELGLKESPRAITIQLANGLEQKCRTFDATVNWGGNPIPIQVWAPTSVGGKATFLIGTSFLKNAHLSANFRERKLSISVMA